MVMNQLDAISAKEGTVFVTIDNRTIELAELISLEAKVELQTADVTPIGARMKKTKIVGAEGSGSVKFYYHRPEIRGMIVNYVKTGKIPEISIKATNNDPTSKAGRHTVLIKGVILKSAKLFAIDGSSNDVLEDETDFTFDDVDMLDTFKSL